jgi:hypothetical protein
VGCIYIYPRKQARPLFDEKVAPKLREMGATDMEKGFNVWFDLELKAVNPEELDKRVNADFRTMAKDELNKIRARSNAKFDEAQNDLGDACKSDVGSQAMRLALAPLGWVAGNFQAAKDNEKNVVTQVFHALTGISPQAIAEHGLLGGEAKRSLRISKISNLERETALMRSSRPMSICAFCRESAN